MVRKKDFLFIGPITMFAYKCVMPDVCSKRVKPWERVAKFRVPDTYESKDGYVVLSNTYWFTTFPVKDPDFTPTATFDIKTNPLCDNSFSFYVDKMKNLPKDDEITVDLTDEQIERLKKTNLKWKFI